MISSTGTPAIGAVELPKFERAEPAGRVAPGGDFAQVLTDAIGQARTEERKAVEASSGFAAGDPSIGIHEVMIASEKASVSVRYATTLKNKLLESYRELMNTAV